MQPSWTPEPIDTSDVQLPDNLQHLTESLARNAHDIWARQRISEGWTFGPVRDDSKMTHPLLIPYEDLPQAEKECDRQLAVGTIKLILKLGYAIPDNGRGSN